jgi:hypothetical protein
MDLHAQANVFLNKFSPTLFIFKFLIAIKYSEYRTTSLLLCYQCSSSDVVLYSLC